MNTLFSSSWTLLPVLAIGFWISWMVLPPVVNAVVSNVVHTVLDTLDR